MSALTKANLVDSLCRELGLSRVDAKQFIDAFFASIITFLEAGDAVKLMHLGSFDFLNKKSRPGRNPKTLEPIEIVARRVVAYHAGEKLKSLVKKIALTEESA